MPSSMSSEISYEPYWTAPSPFTPQQNGLNSAVCTEQMKIYFSHILNKEVIGVKSDLIGSGRYNVVYELVFSDAAPLAVARICFNFKETDEGRKYATETTTQEVAILKFLEAKVPEIIVPRVLGYDADPRNLIGSPFILQSKILGCNLLAAAVNKGLWQDFSFHTFIPGLACALVDLFSVEIPTTIGPVIGISENGNITVGAFREEENCRASDTPFQSVQEYIRWRVHAIKWEDRADAPVNIPALLQRLDLLSQRLIARLDPLLLRTCLVHLDPRDRNVLVKGREFCGLVDWQAVVLPAFMAAEYPPYLRYDGMREDRYAALNEFGDIQFPNGFMRPSKDTAKILRDLYLESCNKRNPLYARALTEGQILRQLVEWLDFVEWEYDFVWAGLELWEEDQRAILDAFE